MGITINKLTGGLGRQSPTKDGVSGLILMLPQITGGAQTNSVYKMLSIEDAESLLITRANELATEYLSWTHINDFFRINPNGTLYVVIARIAPYPFADSIASGVNLLMQASNGEIRQIACAYNGEIPADDTLALSAITAAQTAATASYNNDCPVHMICEGNFGLSYPDLRTLNSKNVSVVAAQNLEVVNYDNGGVGVISANVAKPWRTHTAIGLVLGAVSLSAVNESIAWVDKFNMLGGTLTQAAVAGVSLATQATLLNTLDGYGYITLRTYNGYPGIYFNGSHTATAITSDFANIQNNRTIDKAIRLIRLALLPYLNSPINVDPTTGQLSPAVVKNFEIVGRRSLDEMDQSEEFSSAIVTVDPSQNILSTSELVLSLDITPTGTAESIVVNVGFVNPFN